MGVDYTDVRIMVPARPETVIGAVRVCVAMLREIGAVASDIPAYIITTRI
jgi:hypothetical protein